MTTGKCGYSWARKKTNQELVCSCVTEQEGMGWCAHMDEQDDSIQTDYWNGPGPQSSPEPCKGVAGSCWLLWAKKSLKDKFKTSLSQC